MRDFWEEKVGALLQRAADWLHLTCTVTQKRRASHTHPVGHTHMHREKLSYVRNTHARKRAVNTLTLYFSVLCERYRWEGEQSRAACRAQLQGPGPSDHREGGNSE